MSEKDLKNWKELPIGGLILEAGNSVKYNSGSWSPQKLIWHSDTCTHCMLCYINCPDASIKVEDSKVVGIDEYHCKCCGICVTHCPTEPKSLELIMEEESL